MPPTTSPTVSNPPAARCAGRRRRPKNPFAIRTEAQVRDELERRGICRISQVRVNQILRQAEEKIRLRLLAPTIGPASTAPHTTHEI